MSDDEFLAAFESCALPRELWTHVAHIRIAWLYLTRFAFDEAAERVCRGIRQYNESVGSRGYHETSMRDLATETGTFQEQ